MPEGDVVWRTARRLHQALAGQVLAGTDLRVPALATQDLSGRTTLEVVSRGKHLLHRIEGGLTLHSHLRMDGSWRVLPLRHSDQVPHHPAGWPHTVRALLWAGSSLVVGDSLGMLDLVETRHEGQVVGHLGPDVLEPGFDQELALTNLTRRAGLPVAQVLLDQRNLAGIGTIYASEPLFEHRISPWTPVGELRLAELRAVVATARLWMVRACRLGPVPPAGPLSAGPADGWRPGNYRVFGRRGLPCRRCGTTISQSPMGHPPRQRQINFCPTCQPTP